jgi:flagellar hook assembly protein FlgD
MGGNPVRIGGAGARFLVSSPNAVPVRFQVFDAAGRLVAEPIRDAVIAGQQVVRWDGSNQRGVAAPSGTYFYRATAGASVATGRIVMVR